MVDSTNPMDFCGIVLHAQLVPERQQPIRNEFDTRCIVAGVRNGLVIATPRPVCRVVKS